MYFRFFKEQRVVGSLADKFMVPMMYLLQGNFREIPQRTHCWNNYKIKGAEASLDLLDFPLLKVSGEPIAIRRRVFGFIPAFHMAIFGGWRKFVVFEPGEHNYDWFIGWHDKSSYDTGISMVPIRGRVRMLVGPTDVEFFALSPTHDPLELQVVGEGRIGNAGRFAYLPLL